MALQRIWEPISIGSAEVKNRVARAANTTSMMPNSLNDDFIAYHRARARGGVGLSILEAGSVHPNSQIAYLVDDSAQQCFEQLMAAVRPYGMRVFQQLWHGGHNMGGRDGAMPWAPSATPSVLSGIVGVPMGQPEIDELIAAFALAAQRCRDAGLDGVEIHAGHGYVIQQFLSPLTNRREDGYGGSLSHRSRFLKEILRAVRAAVGVEFTVGVRLSASTAVGGAGVEDIATVAAELETEGLIDFLDISYSDYFLMSGMAPTMAVASGYQLPINRPIAASVSVPRIVTGRYRTLEEAEQVLRENQADLVSLVRAHIADPDIVRKTRAGIVDDVRPCIACNQGCIGGLLQIGKMQCTVNPAAGYEASLDEELIVKAPSAKRVFVVGGGPAGMEAARVAALRGHQVILAEAAAKLGGKVDVAKRAPYLQILADLIAWQERQIFALGVEVRLNTFVEAEEILAEQTDALIIATGGANPGDGRQARIPGELPYGIDSPNVMNPVELLTGPAQPMAGKKALVFDDVGRYDAIAAAEFLQSQGAGVNFVTSQTSFAPKMFGTSRDTESLARLHKNAFRLWVCHHLVGVEAGNVRVRPIGVECTESIAADVVVMVTSDVPNRDLFDQIRGKLEYCRLVGDALSPRDLLAAIHDGHHAARGL